MMLCAFKRALLLFCLLPSDLGVLSNIQGVGLKTLQDNIALGRMARLASLLAGTHFHSYLNLT